MILLALDTCLAACSVALMADGEILGWLSEPTAPGMADFHRSKRRVHGLMRQLDRESRDAMRGAASDRRS